MPRPSDTLACAGEAGRAGACEGPRHHARHSEPYRQTGTAADWSVEDGHAGYAAGYTAGFAAGHAAGAAHCQATLSQYGDARRWGGAQGSHAYAGFPPAHPTGVRQPAAAPINTASESHEESDGAAPPTQKKKRKRKHNRTGKRYRRELAAEAAGAAAAQEQGPPGSGGQGADDLPTLPEDLYQDVLSTLPADLYSEEAPALPIDMGTHEAPAGALPIDRGTQAASGHAS